MWRENAQVSFYLFLFVSEATLIIHRWKMGKTRNRINEPIALSCPSAIVEYHDYHSHSLTHNKITVNNKLVYHGDTYQSNSGSSSHGDRNHGNTVTCYYGYNLLNVLTYSHDKIKINTFNTFIIFRSNILHLFYNDNMLNKL